MGGRQTTDILLAIIAGVLLFGSAAVTGAIKWIAIIGGALLFLYAVIAFALYLLRESVKALQEAKALGRDAFLVTLMGLTVVGFLPIVAGYALLLWLQSVPKPFDVVTHSWVGTIWLGIFVVGCSTLAISALITRRDLIIPALQYGFSLLIRSPLAPVFLTMHGWRKARMAGDGIISSTASAFVGLFFGLMFWAIAFGMIMGALGK
ncbi:MULTISPECIES: hypothetical protein [Rhizobium]|uniref:hypothetical protein n=1 Tax=Rhizobium TaxID=379 RepID=UPI00103265E2|nr:MULTISPECIES: hypothetical protein [Rhizobium]TAX51881.1 hypothetical protein ELH99_17720 [Rhizobium leguminosarum]TBB50222.1 hypothetical protein ELH46_16255 [Rhizobium ruizarguesonis]TCB17933.1 hypothetical protein E0J18_12750 [Rhizobium leguminosarum bv. viciae]